MIIMMLIAAVGCSVIFAVSIGQVSIPFTESYRILIYQLTGIEIGDLHGLTSGTFVDIIWQIRLPRVLMAMIVGSGLALCGTVMQASVQNPLADPYIWGISSGDSLGATFSIMVGFGAAGIIGEMGIAMWAFVGAIGAAGFVLILASICDLTNMFATLGTLSFPLLKWLDFTGFITCFTF
ncbi:iron ABC transporter permease [Paenibacillus baimaensis]|nr:iron ABC transporter permease [Paenibacillus sp. WQ 127069]